MRGCESKRSSALSAGAHGIAVEHLAVNLGSQAVASCAFAQAREPQHQVNASAFLPAIDNWRPMLSASSPTSLPLVQRVERRQRDHARRSASSSSL